MRAALLLGSMLLLGGLPAPCRAAEAAGRHVDAPPAPTDLPDVIHLKTPTRTFNGRFYFAVEGGRIYYKPIPEATGATAPWRPLGGTGLPRARDGLPGFDEPTTVVSIHADASALAAVAADGRFYYVQVSLDSPRGRYGVKWWDSWGFPLPGEVWLTDGAGPPRGWAIGRRAQDVLYYEDIDQNPHHYGVMGITTLYVLSKDGRQLRFTDSGLPPSLGRCLCLPERGTFEALSLSASASTMMVIDARGRIFTRLADFDTIGSDVMLYPYTYTRQHRPEERGDDPDSRHHPWSLPSEPWVEQPPVPLEGAAGLTSAITILQDGQGNAARELRVAGLSPDGRQGYYHKRLLDPSWAFRPAPWPEGVSLLERGEGAPPPAKPWLIPNGDGRYAGVLELGDAGRWEVELLDLNLDCSPATLRIHAGGQEADLILHTVEAWDPAARGDPGHDGGPEVQHGTLEIPPDAFAALDGASRDRLEAALRPLHLDTFALFVYAQPGAVEIVGSRHRVDLHLRAERRLPEGYQGPPLQALDGADTLTRMAQQPFWIIEDLEALTVFDLPRLGAVIEANRHLRRALRWMYLQRHFDTRNADAVAVGFTAVSGLLKVTGLGRLRPPFSTLAQWVGPLGRAQSRAAHQRLRVARADLLAATTLVDTRLEAYQARRRVLEDTWR